MAEVQEAPELCGLKQSLSHNLCGLDVCHITLDFLLRVSNKWNPIVNRVMLISGIWVPVVIEMSPLFLMKMAEIPFST